MLKIEIQPPKLHPGQLEVYHNPARFRVVSAGRRWGKTMLGSLECLRAAVHGGRAWWVAPSYKMARVGWRAIRLISRQIPVATIRRGDWMIILPNGGEIWVRSADNPDSLRGEGLDFVVIDEAAYVNEDTWLQAIRPALSDRQGRALFISTPNGLNWFWDMYRMAEYDKTFASFSFPTSSNPHIPPEEIEKAKAELPELIFRQEYLAEFVSMEGSVFRRVHDAVVREIDPTPAPGKQYVLGVDVAQSVDYTVITVMDAEARRVVYIDRFNRVDYPVLADRIARTADRYNHAVVVVEANSAGQAVIDMLVQSGVDVVSFVTTSASKQIVIRDLQAAFEAGDITIPDNPILISELLSFESKRSPSGSFSYSAPEGMHDDCVMSLALAWHGAKQPARLFVFGGEEL